MTPDSDCIFCQIVAQQTPADVVFDGGDTLFFYDISPKAKVHIVGITKEHIASMHTIKADHHSVIGKLLHDAAHVAEDVGLMEGGYRVITNIGTNAGQMVSHIHFHILGGEPLGPMNARNS